MSTLKRRREILAIRRIVEYVRGEAEELAPAPTGLIAALSIALEELQREETVSDPRTVPRSH
jgi:hypothetical protein